MARSKGREVHDWEEASDSLQSGEFIVDICTTDGELFLENVYVTGVDAQHIRIRHESNSFNKMHYRVFRRGRP